MENELYNFYLNNICEIPDFLNKYLEVPSIVRLKKISYFCGMDYASKNIYDFKEKISRYDQSLTVALLTWKYTQDKNATISGLLHDIASPCFSHVIDYMNKDYINQESTEEYTHDIIRKDKKLLEYLKEDNINIDYVSNFKNFSIVDNKRPKLCTDRFDGIILPAIAWTKSINKQDIIDMINDLTIYTNEDNEKELGFKHQSIASRALYHSDLIDEYCRSKEDYYMMELMATIIRIAINNKLITYDELYLKGEEDILSKIKDSNLYTLNSLMNTFENIKIEDIPNDEMHEVKKKVLNPLVDGKRLIDKKGRL